ncbi:MAG: hypothetical protein R6U20_07405 [Longimonas sp.]|uniref:hypothetical protein n=1 Tax=Longimonas sp. TaxID=2039626 RepID=UPI003974A8F9
MATSVIQDALALLRDQSAPQAIDRLETAVVETPAYPAAYVLLARAYESQDAWEAARSAWDQAFMLMPHSPTVQEGRHRIRARLRKTRSEASEAPSAPTPVASEEPPSSSVPDAAGSSPNASADSDASSEAFPSLSMEDGPTDLESLRAQTERSARQQHTSSSAQPTASPAEALGDLDDDLDRLIEELQSARIQPDPDVDDVPPPDLDDDIEDMVSETLARIYASQGAYHEAARVYVQLAVQEPDRSDEFLREASTMRQKATAADDASGDNATDSTT